MSLLEHRKAIRIAERSGDEILALFARLGTGQHPRGAILNAYRAARLNLAGNLDNPRLVLEILQALRGSILYAVREEYNNALLLGLEFAERQLDIYSERIYPDQETRNKAEAAIALISAGIDKQIAAVNTATYTADAESMVLGDESRAGILSPVPTTRDANTQLTGIFVGIMLNTFGNSVQDDVYYKQAIAAIDMRTTDCCLRVHGQAVPMNSMFELTGTPRFADRMEAPGFHWNCRTSLALVLRADAGDDLTVEMERTAKDEITRRIDDKPPLKTAAGIN